ncbi:MAG TPA: hypothetical protein VD794_04000 [Flavisolibacter sp.]|nr:hypothetical protein [Flavisolibacter sp.]
MKYVYILGLLLCGTAAMAQTNPVSVTMNGIGEIKVGMSKKDLEKLIGVSISSKRLSDDDWSYDTVRFYHKTIHFEAILSKELDAKQEPYIAVWGITSDNNRLRTKSGISIGDDKLKVINTYEMYSINLSPANEGPDFSTKSKTQSYVTLYSDDGTRTIIFHLTRNKVTAISVAFNLGC